MASLTMTASFLSTATPPASRPPGRRILAVSRPAAPPQLSGRLRREEGTESDGRRGLLFAAAAAAAVAVAVGKFPAVAEEEKESGSKKLRKLYAPVCVTMPTASVCHK